MAMNVLPHQKGVSANRESDRLKNSSHHQKGVATNTKRLKSHKNLVPPQRSGNNVYRSEGAKSYSLPVLRAKALPGKAGTYRSMYHKGQQKLRKTPSNWE